MTDMGLFHAMYHCRAMRRLKPDPVPRELLLKLVDAAHQGPSASNKQNDRWLVITRADIKQRVADLNRAAIASYGVTFDPKHHPPHSNGNTTTFNPYRHYRWRPRAGSERR